MLLLLNVFLNARIGETAQQLRALTAQFPAHISDSQLPVTSVLGTRHPWNPWALKTHTGLHIHIQLKINKSLLKCIPKYFILSVLL